MLNRVRLKTWVVLGKREARTVEAMRAAFVLREAGNLALLLVVVVEAVVAVALSAEEEDADDALDEEEEEEEDSL